MGEEETDRVIHILGRRRDNHWESSTCSKRRRPRRHSAWIVAQHQKLFGAAIDNCADNAMRLPSSNAQRLSVLSFVPVVRSAAGPFILARRGALCQALHTTYVPRQWPPHIASAIRCCLIFILIIIAGINLFKR